MFVSGIVLQILGAILYDGHPFVYTNHVFVDCVTQTDHLTAQPGREVVDLCLDSIHAAISSPPTDEDYQGRYADREIELHIGHAVHLTYPYTLWYQTSNLDSEEHLPVGVAGGPTGEVVATVQSVLRHSTAATTLSGSYTQRIPASAKKVVNDYERLIYAAKPAEPTRAKLQRVK